MSIAPPAERLWWKQPMPRVEVAWIAIASMVILPWTVRGVERRLAAEAALSPPPA